MTKREAKRWACGLVAADIEANIFAGCYDLDNADSEYDVKREALMEISRELRRRSGEDD